MRRQAVDVLREERGFGITRACGLMGSHRSTCRYQVRTAENGKLRERLRELAEQFRRFGYRRLHDRLTREGWRVNHKRIERLYREELQELAIVLEAPQVAGLGQYRQSSERTNPRDRHQPAAVGHCSPR